MNRTFKPREGVALPTAILAIVVIGALITGGFLVANQQERLGRNTLGQTWAIRAAEYGQNRLYAEWSTAWNNTLKPGDTLTRVYLPGDGSVDTTRLTRLNDWSFLATSTGRAQTGVGTGGSAVRQTGMILRLKAPQNNFQGALTTKAGVRMEQSSLNGSDAPMPGYCPAPGPAVAGVVEPPGAGGTWNDGGGTWTGTPNELNSTVATDPNTYTNFGGFTWDELTALATDPALGKVFSGAGGARTYVSNAGPAVSSGTCNKGVTSNFGDINRAATPGPCEGYLPIIHAKTGLELEGGSGQGILLVDGGTFGFRMERFTWHGLVIVKGRLDMEGSKVYGAVLAMNSTGDASEVEKAGLPNPSLIQYSSCAISQSLRLISKPSRSPRDWLELY